MSRLEKMFYLHKNEKYEYECPPKRILGYKHTHTHTHTHTHRYIDIYTYTYTYTHTKHHTPYIHIHIYQLNGDLKVVC